MLIQPTPAVIRSRGRALSTLRPQPLQAREPQPLQAREHRSALGSRPSMLRSSPDAAELCAVCKSAARGARDWLVHLYALTLACPQSSGSLRPKAGTVELGFCISKCFARSRCQRLCDSRWPERWDMMLSKRNCFSFILLLQPTACCLLTWKSWTRNWSWLNPDSLI